MTEHEILRRALGLCEDLLEICEDAELDAGAAAEILAELEIDYAARERRKEAGNGGKDVGRWRM